MTRLAPPDSSAHEVPHLLARCMEAVGAIPMDVDSLHIFTTHIATNMTTLVDDKAGLALLVGKVGESGSKQAGANN